jgi:hypothetical protein
MITVLDCEPVDHLKADIGRGQALWVTDAIAAWRRLERRNDLALGLPCTAVETMETGRPAATCTHPGQILYYWTTQRSESWRKPRGCGGEVVRCDARG